MLMPISKEVEKGKPVVMEPLLDSQLCSFFFCSVCRIVEYATYDDMRCAMRKLDGTELNGRKLRLIEDYRGRKRRFARNCMYVCIKAL